MFKEIKYHGLMHLVILSWGFTSILGKLIHLEFYQIVFFRLLLAGLSMAIILPLIGKDIRIKDRMVFWKVLGIGILVLCHWLSFFKAIQVSTASVGVLCLATTTLHVSWIEPLVMRRKFSWIEFIFGLLVVCGIGFITDKIDPSQYKGILWGLLSALFAASFSVFNARLRKDGTSSASITVYEMFTGVLVLFVFLLFSDKIDVAFFKMTWSDFYWLLFLAIICTSVAYTLMIDIVNKIGVFAASLTVNLEPVYSIILAVFILHENTILGNQFYFGALFIILIIFLNPVVKFYFKKKKNAIVRRI